MRIRLLPNGFARVDDSAGLVRLWEMGPDGRVSLRSGDGRPMAGEREQVARVMEGD